MKIYGYADEGLPIEDVVSRPLAEITLCASPQELRQMAGFLMLCADEMDKLGPKYGHLHLSDRCAEFEQSPHFVVFPAEA